MPVYALTIHRTNPSGQRLVVGGSTELSESNEHVMPSGHCIWKERNAHVFGHKISSTNKIVQDIQLKS